MKTNENLSLSKILINCAPLFFLLYCIIYFYFGERYQVFDGGLRWDQLLYGDYAKDFFHQLMTHRIDDYHATRLLPSLLVYLGSHFFGYNLSSDNKIFSAFLIYDSLLLTISVWLWKKISEKAQFPAAIFWLGFFSLFINLCNFKAAQYCPIQTDTTAFFFGMLLLYLYVSEKPLLICLAACIATFAWQVCIYFALFLVLNPQRIEVRKNTASLNRSRELLSKIFPTVVLLSFLLLVLYFNIINPHLLYSGAYQVNKLLLPVTAAIAGIYVLYVVKNSNFVDRTLSTKLLSQWRNKNVYYWLMAIGCYLFLLRWIKMHYGAPDGYGFYQFFWMTFVLSVVKPGISLLSHIVYFGPIFIIFLLNIRQIMQVSYETGYGALCFLVLTLAMSLSSESRFLMFNIPVFVYLICQTLSSMDITTSFVKFYAIISLIMSRFYIPAHPVGNFPYEGILLEFSGPWMDWRGYCVNLVLVCLCSYLVYKGLKKAHPKFSDIKISGLQKM